MFQFPANKTKRGQWLTAFGLSEGNTKEHTRICSRHFLGGDSNQVPTLKLVKRFSSPKKNLCQFTQHAKTAGPLVCSKAG